MYDRSKFKYNPKISDLKTQDNLLLVNILTFLKYIYNKHNKFLHLQYICCKIDTFAVKIKCIEVHLL